MLRTALRHSSSYKNVYKVASNIKKTDYAVCTLSKLQLSFNSLREELESADIQVAYKIIDGIPILVTREERSFGFGNHFPFHFFQNGEFKQTY